MNQRVRRCLVAIVALGLVASAIGMPTVAAEDTSDGITFVQDDVTRNTSWTSEGGPYRVIRDVDVATGATLTLEPGTEVEVAEGVSVTVRGSLLANGTATEGVSLTRTDGAPSDARWAGIEYRGGSDSMLSLSNATVAGAETAITVNSEEGRVSLTDTTLRDLSAHGLQATTDDAVPAIELDRATIRDVEKRGLSVAPGTGPLDSIAIETGDDTIREPTNHRLSLVPGVPTKFDRLVVEYGARGNASGVDANDLTAFGLDTNQNGEVNRSLEPLLDSVRATDSRIVIDLTRSVTVGGDEQLLLAMDDVTNPATRGVYRVDVDLRNEGVSQVAEDVHAPLVIGDVSTDHADTTVVEPTAVRGLTVRQTTFDDIGEAATFVSGDRVAGLRMIGNDVQSAGGDAFDVRARSIRGDLAHNDLTATDAGVEVAIRERASRLRVVNNRVQDAEVGLRLSQSGARARAALDLLVAKNEFASNERYGLEIDAPSGRLAHFSISNNTLTENGQGGAKLSLWGADTGSVADNRVLDNEGPGIAIGAERLRTVDVRGGTIRGNADDGIRLAAVGPVRGVQIRNLTTADNGGHGAHVGAGVIVHDVTVADTRALDNGGAGVAVTSSLTHGGSVDVSRNLIAANNYGVYVRGAITATVANNTIVYNRNPSLDPVPLVGVDAGTGIGVVEGAAGAIVDRGTTDVPLSEVVANPRIDAQLVTASGDDPAVVLRTDGQGHAHLDNPAALALQSVSGQLPTGVAIPTDSDVAGISAAGNDVYGHDRGLAVNVSHVIEANTTARLVVASARTVTAEETFWGSSDGPYHSSILPSGNGDTVATLDGWVDFVPYATSPHGDRYERPRVALDAPATAAPGEMVTVTGRLTGDSDVPIDRYAFAIGDATADSGADDRFTFEMPNESTTVRLGVENELGIESAEIATATVEPAVETTSTTTTTSSSSEPTTTTVATTTGVSERSGPLTPIATWLGGLFYLAALLLGAFGMWLTVTGRDPPLEGITIHAVAIGAVVVWGLAGLIAGGGLFRLALVGAVIWAALTGMAYLVVTRVLE